VRFVLLKAMKNSCVQVCLHRVSLLEESAVSVFRCGRDSRAVEVVAAGSSETCVNITFIHKWNLPLHVEDTVNNKMGDDVLHNVAPRTTERRFIYLILSLLYAVVNHGLRDSLHAGVH
jgi:hypothetical protein